MKRLIALTLSLTLAAMVGPVSAQTTEREDYLRAKEDQKTYYQEIYKPCYKAYNQTLKELQRKIRETDFETAEQLERVRGFVNELKERRWAFFGDRETPGKSRYDVPQKRQAMYDAEDAGNYDDAVVFCAELKYLVTKRVDFLNELAYEVGRFEIREPSNGILSAPELIAQLPSDDAVTTKKLQEAVLAAYGAFPALSTAEKAMMQQLGFAGADALNWRPIVAVNGEILLAGSASEQSKQNPLCPVLYYQGNYYYWYHFKSVKTHYVSEFTFDVTVLDSEKTALAPEDTGGAWLRL